MSDLPLTKIRLLADLFVEWQTPYGRPDPQRCPFVTQRPFISTHLHSPTFLAIGLYRAYQVTGEPAYKGAADRYITYYFSCLRHPPQEGPRQDYPCYPYQYGMALAGYRDFRKHNPDEGCLDGKAAAVYEWLLTYRWDQGSYFRNGYGVPKYGIVDCANSDDILHMGRGLMGYYEVSGRAEVLADAEGLAPYYLTEGEVGTFKGCWSSQLGTWMVAPTVADSFEHFQGLRACDIGWGFSAVGVTDYLSQLAQVTQREDLKAGIADRCATSMKWQFDACQFDDGACGMHGRDDKWIGMTAGAILSFLRTRQAGLLSEEEVTAYLPKALKAKEWLLQHLDEGSILAGGYFRITGQSEPRPPENQAWQLGWTLEALARLSEL